MRQIVDDEHLGIYGIVARHIEFIPIGRLLLLMNDMLTDRCFRQLEYLQVILGFNLHCQNHVPHKIGQPRWNLSHHAARQKFLIVEHFRFSFLTKSKSPEYFRELLSI